ncbi:MAG: DEAD/DEAH box helicase, partial [Myxococcota bacterium]
MWKNVVFEHAFAAAEGLYEKIPDDLHPRVKAALEGRGLSRLYRHQAEAFRAAIRGLDLVIATPTASGKSLAFNLPVLNALADSPQARALYLFPTKALSRDQEHSLRRLLREAELDHGAVTFDGDTPPDARRSARDRSGVLITNPDMLHTGVLPHHARWARLFANLRFVVVDEVHAYRGVFGSHLANVLRRVLRVARFHGAEPQLLFSSATIANPEDHASRLAGRAVCAITQNGAPVGRRRVVFYNPPVVNAELGIRRSCLKEAVRLAADLVRAEVPTIVFGQSRNQVEVMLKYLRDATAADAVEPEAIQAYRGGYLSDTRRRIERSLRGGAVRCVVATHALEMGIDIGSLEAVVCAGFPGTMAGLWQRFGRAGRRDEHKESLAVLVASSAPLDQFLAGAPRSLVEAPVERARIDPDNIEILIQHLKCGAFELPFDEAEGFGDVPSESVQEALRFLAEHRVIHEVDGRHGRKVYHWSDESFPAHHVPLRSVTWDNFVIIEVDKDRTLAEMDFRSAHTMLHEQAIYQHDGRQ